MYDLSIDVHLFVSYPAKVSYVISQHEDILTNHFEKLDIVMHIFITVLTSFFE